MIQFLIGVFTWRQFAKDSEEFCSPTGKKLWLYLIIITLQKARFGRFGTRGLERARKWTLEASIVTHSTQSGATFSRFGSSRLTPRTSTQFHTKLIEYKFLVAFEEGSRLLHLGLGAQGQLLWSGERAKSDEIVIMIYLQQWCMLM